MAYRKITAAEGAAMINDGENIGFSGFTPNGVPKAVIRDCPNVLFQNTMRVNLLR